MSLPLFIQYRNCVWCFNTGRTPIMECDKPSCPGIHPECGGCFAGYKDCEYCHGKGKLIDMSKIDPEILDGIHYKACSCGAIMEYEIGEYVDVWRCLECPEVEVLS